MDRCRRRLRTHGSRRSFSCDQNFLSSHMEGDGYSDLMLLYPHLRTMSIDLVVDCRRSDRGSCGVGWVVAWLGPWAILPAAP